MSHHKRTRIETGEAPRHRRYHQLLCPSPSYAGGNLPDGWVGEAEVVPPFYDRNHSGHEFEINVSGYMHCILRLNYSVFLWSNNWSCPAS